MRNCLFTVAMPVSAAFSLYFPLHGCRGRGNKENLMMLLNTCGERGMGVTKMQGVLELMSAHLKKRSVNVCEGLCENIFFHFPSLMCAAVIALSFMYMFCLLYIFS